MKNNINLTSWLLKEEFPVGSSGPAAAAPPMGQPGTPGDPMGAGMPDPMAGQPPMDQGPPDISNDPQYPDMGEEEEDGSEQDFETWKSGYIKESIKGDPYKLVQKIVKVREMELEPIQRKFVEDNLDINFLRQDANILQASNEVRKRIKKEFDRTHPATAVLSHIAGVLDERPMLNEIFIKLNGLGGGKMDQHRKFVGSLTGSVQVGNGGQNEDLIFEESDYSIRLSTRFNARWGDVNIGRWHLKEDDPERFLKEPELDRLEGGSPEEKDVLRRRVIIESISEAYRERAFIINVVGSDGTVYHLGWDLGNCLKAAFLEGKLVVRTSDNDNKEAFIDNEGSVVTIPHMGIYYIKEAESLNDSGKSELEEHEFMSHRDGMLFLTAPLDLVKEASVTLEGMLLKETLWQGNPSDLLKIQRCVPSSADMLLRRC